MIGSVLQINGQFMHFRECFAGKIRDNFNYQDIKRG